MGNTPKPTWRERSMRLKRNKLRDAIAFSLAASAVMLAGAGSALAQDAAEEQTATEHAAGAEPVTDGSQDPAQAVQEPPD